MKVSICIPAYKHVDFLKRCVDSILEQSYADYEIIITDDSPDDSISMMVANRYVDKNIRYYKNEKALGSPSNWNKSLEYAQGDYVKIMHHDDWFSSPDSLAEYVRLLDENPDVDIAFSGSCAIDTKGRRKEHKVTSVKLDRLNDSPDRLFMGNLLGAPSVCIFRNKKGYTFDPNLIWLVDTDFYIRVIGGKGFAYSSGLFVNIGVSEFQITNSDLSNNKIRLKEKISLYHKFDLQSKPFVYRRSLLKALGREGIFSDSQLNRYIADSGFSFAGTDVLWARYYFMKRKVGLLLGR